MMMQLVNGTWINPDLVTCVLVTYGSDPEKDTFDTCVYFQDDSPVRVEFDSKSNAEIYRDRLAGEITLAHKNRKQGGMNRD